VRDGVTASKQCAKLQLALHFEFHLINMIGCEVCKVIIKTANNSLVKSKKDWMIREISLWNS